MSDELIRNVDHQIEILREMSAYSNRAVNSGMDEKRVLEESIVSLKERLKIVNDAVPALIAKDYPLKNLAGARKVAPLVQIKAKNVANAPNITIKSADRGRFLKELEISDNLLRKIKRRKDDEKEKGEEFQSSRGYIKLSNRFFLQNSIKLIKEGYFRSLVSDVNKANLGLLPEVYVSMMFLSTLIAMAASFVFMIFLLFFKISFLFPYVFIYSGEMVSRILTVIWLPGIVTVAVFLFLYSYPSSERKNVARKVEQELPFAVIHMSAVAGSGIEPVQIFKIIGLSKEYPFLRLEIRKVMNQINIYGYDLVTALNNVQKNTSSQKLSELFTGISTTLSSGGNLSDFFAKRAETLLVDYRLEREKYTKVAETFMDIYISVVIAAPMILMLVVVMMSLSGLNLPFTPGEINLMTISAIALINLVFLMFLKFKQPSY